MKAPAISPAYAAILAEVKAGIELGEARVRLRKASAANPQVTAFLQPRDLSTDARELQKAADLLEHAGRQPRRREILTEPGNRRAKLSIETCRVHPVTGEVLPLPPLQPWDCPVPCGLLAYSEIMLAEDGKFSLADFTGDRLTALEWMRDEELICIGTAGEVRALSDAGYKDARKYPGAPCSDARAGIGRQLREHAEELIRLALVNLSLGRTVRRVRRRKGRLERSDGITITAARVAEEANAIKARRPDLAECRYLSLGRCRQLIRSLVDREVIEEIQPPQPVRQKRSWRTLPRVIRRLTADADGMAGLRPMEVLAA